MPRPAIEVEIVTLPAIPAWAMISASRSCCLALSSSQAMSSFASSAAMRSEDSIVVVPTSTGWPRALQSLMSARIASSFEACLA